MEEPPLHLDEGLVRLRQFIRDLHATPQPSQEKAGSVAQILEGATYFEREEYGGVGLTGVELASYRQSLHDISEIATKKDLISAASVESHVKTAILTRKIHDFRSTKGLAMVQIRCLRGFETKSEAFA